MSDQRPVPVTKSAEKFVVRLPQGMRDRIAEAARQYRRSMNSEIVSRLERSLDGLPLPDPREDATEVPAEPETDSAAQTRSLSEVEVQLINLFRRLPDTKRAAILDLLS